MPPPLLRAAFASPGEFLAAFDAELAQGGLLVRGAEVGAAQAMSECRVAVEVAGSPAVEVPGRIAAVVPGVGTAVLLQGMPPPLAALAEVLRAPAGPVEAEPPRGALTDRIKAMTVQQKMQLARSGGREERLAPIRDHTKAAHVFVLKNPRIGLDEVQDAARSPSLAPDALKLIAELRAIAKGGARDQLVHAARKRVAG